MPADQLQDLIDGMTQDERRIEALDPSYVRIDDRKLEDLLKYMIDLSAQINFYNEKNEIEGDWQDFFKSDLNILVLLITRYDLTNHLSQFEKLEYAIQTAPGDVPAVKALKSLFDFLGGLARAVIGYNEQLLSGTAYNKTAFELSELLTAFLPDIAQVAEFNRQARDSFGTALEPSFEAPEYYVSEPVDDTPIFGRYGEAKQRILPGLPIIKKIFTGLQSKYTNFLAVTSFYFKDHDIRRQEFHPHLALCIAFLELFKYLQDQVNELPRAHLDFYYQEILGLEMKGAQPDSAYVVFEPSTVDKVLLPAGEQLVGEFNKTTATYALSESLTITRARIADLKTVYLDSHVQVNAEDPDDPDVIETEVYKSVHPVIQAKDYQTEKSALKSWPVFGESQFELSDEDRTMEDTDLGVLLASPVLYLSEGERTVNIKIFFESGSFIQLLQYFRSFAKATGKLLQTASYELLSDAFVIGVTAADGWLDIRRYTVSTNMAESNIEIEFQLSPVDKGIDVYQAEVHGGNYGTEWPIVRLLLNNYSTHNAFSFFRKLIIGRVTINSRVTGSRALKLQNNVGNLSADNPFHPFGPMPTVGSFLDIKNTNIFNRYTKDFSIRLEWIELPRNRGGWDDYYRAYDIDLGNESFKVRLSALSQGKFKPQPAKRQEFNLFQIESGGFGEDILSEVSELKDVDIKKLELPNRPLLAREAMLADQSFTEGAVRLEFSAPAEGFGNRVYPQLLSETVMHNARRFVTKKEVPNPPSVPVVRSISVDYTLEHSEVLVKTFSNEDSALKVIHLYPFGFDEIYPENDRQPYPFIPDFEYPNNLYIGISDLLPEQDISLLFQIHEQNSSDVAKDPDPVTWSYLYNNLWTELEPARVLYDTTNQFINTGVVKLRLPEDVRRGNTRLASDLYWLRASSSGKNSSLSRVIGIYPNAVLASRVITDDIERGQLIMPPFTIRDLKNKIRGIEGVYQLLPSFGGKPAESKEDYYVRVSERLRHKNRMVTTRDIEQAILEHFPGILMAKCISADSDTGGIFRPGNKKIRVIVVPRESQTNLLMYSQPRVDVATLYQIRNFIKTSVSPFSQIEIENPVYEKLKIVAKIKFKDSHSSDSGLYTQRLNDDIRRYLCPWLYESRSAFKIGSRVYTAEVLNFIKKRSYVDYVTGFSMLHFFGFENAENGEMLSGVNDFSRTHQTTVQGSVPEAVIIPSEEHMFTVIEEAEFTEASKAGIGNLAIGEELLVFDKSLSESPEENSIIENSYTDDDEYISLFIDHDIN